MKYVDSKCDACNNDNALMHHVICKLFSDTDSYGHVKSKEIMHNDQAVF